MKCPRCNTPLVADASFCGICGYSVSELKAGSPAVKPSSLSSADNQPTLMATRWPDAQPVQERQAPVDAQPTMRQTPPPTQPADWYGGAPLAQPGAFQQPQAAAWSQQAAWSPTNPPQGAYPPGMLPGVMSSTSAPAARSKRRGGCLGRGFMVLVLLLAVLAGVWFLGLRPYVHGMAQSQLDQALNDAENQILLFQTVLPPGRQVVHVPESSINSYLSTHDSDQLQNLHMTITSDGLQLDFNAYGFSCTIMAKPIVSGGALQVTNVQVQGVLWLVMSSDELTTDLNSHFLDIGNQMHRTIEIVTLHEHEMDIQIK